jgi:hydrogenase expression/formation protein HypC
MAQVDFGGITREVCLDYLPEAAVGDYCIVHVGFAITLLSEAEAQETLAMLQDIVELGNGDGAVEAGPEESGRPQVVGPRGPTS